MKTVVPRSADLRTRISFIDGHLEYSSPGSDQRGRSSNPRSDAHTCRTRGHRVVGVASVVTSVEVIETGQILLGTPAVLARRLFALVLARVVLEDFTTVRGDSVLVPIGLRLRTIPVRVGEPWLAGDELGLKELRIDVVAIDIGRNGSHSGTERDRSLVLAVGFTVFVVWTLTPAFANVDEVFAAARERLGLVRYPRGQSYTRSARGRRARRYFHFHWILICSWLISSRDSQSARPNARAFYRRSRPEGRVFSHHLLRGKST